MLSNSLSFQLQLCHTHRKRRAAWDGCGVRTGPISVDLQGNFFQAPPPSSSEEVQLAAAMAMSKRDSESQLAAAKAELDHLREVSSKCSSLPGFSSQTRLVLLRLSSSSSSSFSFLFSSLFSFLSCSQRNQNQAASPCSKHTDSDLGRHDDPNRPVCRSASRSRQRARPLRLARPARLSSAR